MITKISTIDGRLGLGNKRAFVRLSANATGSVRNGEDAKAAIATRGLNLSGHEVYVQRDPLGGVEAIVGPKGTPVPHADDWPSAQRGRVIR